MMRALVIDDDAEWREVLSLSLSMTPGPGLEVDTAHNIDEAWRKLELERYTLVTVDISLVAIVTPTQVINRDGFALLERMRAENASADAALFVVSVHADAEHVIKAFGEYRVDGFIDKNIFARSNFPALAQNAIRAAIVRGAERRIRDRAQVTISVAQDRFVSAELAGPVRKGTYHLRNGFDSASYAARADDLNLKVIAGDADAWRVAARDLGRELHRTLMTESGIAEVLIRGADLSSRNAPTVVQFSGPPPALGVPFELLTDGSDYLCFDHVIVRRLALDGLPPTKKGQPFHEFVHGLIETRQPLRVLLIASNSDGRIPQVDVEIDAIHHSLSRALQTLAIPASIDPIHSKDATFANVQRHLSSGCYHVVHYAGHGRFDDDLPEIGGLLFRDGSGLRELPATELKLLLGRCDLRLFFLSCCLGARSAQQLGRGDFHGIIDGVVRADVPIAIGYRWTVPDLGARRFAMTFYTELLETLSPGVALLRSRRVATNDDEGGRDNSMWASAVMVCQTEP